MEFFYGMHSFAERDEMALIITLDDGFSCTIPGPLTGEDLPITFAALQAATTRHLKRTPEERAALLAQALDTEAKA